MSDDILAWCGLIFIALFFVLAIRSWAKCTILESKVYKLSSHVNRCAEGVNTNFQRVDNRLNSLHKAIDRCRHDIYLLEQWARGKGLEELNEKKINLLLDYLKLELVKSQTVEMHLRQKFAEDAQKECTND